MINPNELPSWLQITRIALTVILTMICGGHAWGRLVTQSDQPSPMRWAFGLYAIAFFFAAWANFVIMLVAIYAGRYQTGPYHVGTFTLLLLVSYFFTASFRLRKRP